MHKKTLALLLYATVLLIDLAFIATDAHALRWYSKTLLMPILIAAYYWLAPQQARTAIGRWLIAALVLSWLGDVFLLQTTDIFFQLGLGSFLLAHIAYMVTFNKAMYTHPPINAAYLRRNWLWLLLGGAYLSLFLYQLRHIGDLLPPVVVYASVLLLMAFAALRRWGNTRRSSAYWVLVGALLFLLSDSLIALNKFLLPLPFADLYIMVLYAAAQYLIVVGCIAHDEPAKANIA